MIQIDLEIFKIGFVVARGEVLSYWTSKFWEWKEIFFFKERNAQNLNINILFLKDVPVLKWNLLQKCISKMMTLFKPGFSNIKS